MEPPSRPEPSSSPSFREFDVHRYDHARIIALLEHIAANVCRVATDVEPFVPVPVAETVHDEIAFSRLESMFDRAQGRG